MCTVDRRPSLRETVGECACADPSLLFVVTAALLAGIGGPQAEARPAADPPARAAAKPCVPARGLVVAMTIRRNLKNGSEVTEPLSGDGYRITRCDTQGRTTISMTVLPIADTGGKRVPAPRGDCATQVDHRPDVRRPGPRHALPRGLSPRPAQAAGQRAPADTRARQPRPQLRDARAPSSPPRPPSRPATTRRTPRVPAPGPRTGTRGAGTPRPSARTAAPSPRSRRPTSSGTRP